MKHKATKEQLFLDKCPWSTKPKQQVRIPLDASLTFLSLENLLKVLLIFYMRAEWCTLARVNKHNQAKARDYSFFFARRFFSKV